MTGKVRNIALVLGVTAGLSVAGVHPVSADSLDELKDKMDDLSNKIEDVHNNKKEKKENITQKQNRLDQVEHKKEETQAEINQLEEEIADMESRIQDKQAQVSETKTKIEGLKKKITETKKRIERRQELLKKRVRVMYKNGGAVNYLQVLLGSQSFTDFLDRVFALNLIAEQDKQLLEAQRADKKQLEKDKAKVQSQLAKLESQLDELEGMQAELRDKKQRKDELVEQLKRKEAELQEHIEKQKKAIEMIEAQISDLIEKRETAREKAEAEKERRARERRARAQRQQEQQSAPATTSSNEGFDNPGNFIIPLPAGSYYISSGYGMRSSGFHDGIDFAAPVGTPIYAVASGTVLYAGAASGFGNWVVIYHDSGLITVYGHMYDNAIYVHQGQHVSQGQTIAAVGSNGHSTGNHLHFEVDRGNISGDNGINPYRFF
ncbi:MAG TPA: peptidoglycan DD-metalloendopeptidase family protein [Bacillales bacterium]